MNYNLIASLNGPILFSSTIFSVIRNSESPILVEFFSLAELDQAIRQLWGSGPTFKYWQFVTSPAQGDICFFLTHTQSLSFILLQLKHRKLKHALTDASVSSRSEVHSSSPNAEQERPLLDSQCQYNQLQEKKCNTERMEN